jgi:hypothetical protein
MGARSGVEVLAEFERRKRDDPDFRARMEREEADCAERVRQLTIAEQPVVADLRALGLELNSVWDLYKIPDSRPQAIPVLIKHLAIDIPTASYKGSAQDSTSRRPGPGGQNSARRC